jgi:hypothetical protein
VEARPGPSREQSRAPSETPEQARARKGKAKVVKVKEEEEEEPLSSGSLFDKVDAIGDYEVFRKASINTSEIPCGFCGKQNGPFQYATSSCKTPYHAHCLTRYISSVLNRRLKDMRKFGKSDPPKCSTCNRKFLIEQDFVSDDESLDSYGSSDHHS